MAGERKVYDQVPYFFSDIFDLSYEFWGDSSEYDEVIYRGDVNSKSFSAWWLKSGRLQAAFVLNRPDEERELAPKWIKDRVPVDTNLLRDTNHTIRELQPA